MVPVTGGTSGGMAGSSTTRHTVEVVTKITADTQPASKAVEELTKRTEQLEKSASKAQQALGGPGANPNAYGSMGRQPYADRFAAVSGGYNASLAQAASRSGVGSAELLAKIGVIAAGAQSVLGAAEAFAKLDTKVGTARQKMDSFLDRLGLVGDVVQAITSSAWNLHDWYGAKSTERNNAIAAFRMQRDIPYQRLVSDMGTREMLRNESLASSSRAYSASQLYARPQSEIALAASADEERDPYQRSEMTARLSAMENTRRAERSRFMARGDLSAAERLTQNSMRGVDNAFSEYMGGGGLPYTTRRLQEVWKRSQTDLTLPPAILQSAIGANSEAIATAEKELARYQQLVADYKSKAMTAAQQEYEYEKAKTAELKTQAEILAAREQKARAAASQIGLMGIDDKSRLLQAAEKYNALGYKSLTQEERGILSGFAPAAEKLRQDAEDFSASDPAFQRLRKLFQIEDAKTVAAERVKVSAEYRLQVEFDEQKHLQALMKVVEKFNEMESRIDKRTIELIDAKLKLQGVQQVSAAR